MIIKNGNWKVYYHIFPDETIYIGITSQKLQERWKTNGYGYKGQKLYDLILKYDWNTEVEHFLFADNLTLEEASNMEKILIKKMREISPYSIRYNIADGGIDALPQKAKEVSQYDLNGNLIKTYSSMTEAAKSVTGYKNIGLISAVCNKTRHTTHNYQWAFGKEETILPLIYEDKGTPVDQFDLKGNYIQTFKNSNQAEKQLNLSHILDCCNNKRRLSGQYQWKFHEENPHCDPIKKRKSARIIDQYDLNNNYIQTWVGLEDLQEYFKLNNKPTHILEVCKNKRKTAYGYKWKFNPEDNKIKATQ